MSIELPYPTVVYKFRDWDIALHKRILTLREVYLAPPSTFTDIDDCRIPIRFDLLSKNDIFKKCIYHSKEDNPKFSRAQHRSNALEMGRKTSIRSKIYYEKFNTGLFEEISEQFGVLSLTANHENERMWVDYSNNHEGFCVGFNSDILFRYLGGGGNVKYYERLPIIYPLPKHTFTQQMAYQFYSKKIEYEYEEEYRTHRFEDRILTQLERQIILPQEAFNCIILGTKMTNANKDDIKSEINNELRGIRIIEL